MTRRELLAFLRSHPLAAQSSVSPLGNPQAAVVGFVVNDQLELFFDTFATSRKCHNLRANGHVALVVGWDLEEACTLQIEGQADEPASVELAEFKKLYFEKFPDGVARQALPDITYFRVRPTWARFSDFRSPEPTIVEFSGVELAAFRAQAP